LNFYGPPGTIRTIPFHRLLRADADVPDLTDAVVFVGEGTPEVLESAERTDMFRAVYSSGQGRDLSGAEIAATAFANLLTGRALRPASDLVKIAVLIGIGLTAGLMFRMLPGRYATVAAIGLIVAYWAIAQHQFATEARLLPLAVPLIVQVPLGLFVAVLSRYRALRRQVPRELEAGQRPQLVQGVCLSTDIENYTVVSHGMEPRRLAALMNEYYRTLGALVRQHGGIMLGRAGDSAMCVWANKEHRWPPGLRATNWLSRRGRKNLDQRRNACRAALEIRKVIDRFNARHSTEPLPTRIGLHAGELALGPVGGEYHVVGDTANAASRIEALNKHLGTTLLASEAVVQDVPGLCVRRLGAFIVPGREDALRVVEIVGAAAEVDERCRNLCRSFGLALALFEDGQWIEALESFQALASDFPADGPTRYFVRLSAHRASTRPLVAAAPIVTDGK
jgi:adenylate cyclase